ncbi:hypothetical protein KKR91_15395 [Arthrobacter jiangjiafuii]|uniref:Uncharacterized protein n=1 Tax=Arthrobacter jiangjiafuii TaxID=2817475 RepID=A0A975M4N4_9MICC|nr:hypothetical protein [Arthrobacter jiangjiafuii]MBP3042428.1 hypothetical protein [Arthrobacter jiangjiafuii]QWC09822.1 hypothetical protein KKR91_15395 [Arthrobacter jiangjiafuii]
MSQHRETGEIPPDSVGPEGRQQTGVPMAEAPGIWPPVTPAAPPAPPGGPAPGAPEGSSGPGPGTGTTRGGRKHLIFGAAGLGIGLIVGLALGQIDIPFASSAINDAAETCNVMETAGIDIGDNGQSISMSSEGNESSGAEYSDIYCVLGELEVPDSVDNRIGTTRALDGRQSADWNEFTSSWGYHPDSGLNIVIEIADK